MYCSWRMWVTQKEVFKNEWKVVLNSKHWFDCTARSRSFRSIMQIMQPPPLIFVLRLDRSPRLKHTHNGHTQAFWSHWKHAHNIGVTGRHTLCSQMPQRNRSQSAARKYQNVTRKLTQYESQYQMACLVCFLVTDLALMKSFTGISSQVNP